jgi:ATP-dependent Lon protease
MFIRKNDDIDGFIEGVAMNKSINQSLVVPIFPLPVVLFPSVDLPLHIFETRYREMIHDVLKSGGTFGVIRIEEGARMSGMGCLARLVELAKLPDGRMNILVQGTERFSVLNLVDGRPYKQARIHRIADSEPDIDGYEVARDVRTALTDIARLSAKLQGTPTDVLSDCPDDPTALSYWVPARLYGSPAEQQRLLEVETTMERLSDEYRLLDETRKHLAAKAALKDAFS